MTETETKFTEPTTIVNSHYGSLITSLALEWCIERGWTGNGPEDIANLRAAIAADKEGEHTFTNVEDGDEEDISDWLNDALTEAEDWATYNLADPNYDNGVDQSGMYFGSHPDLGDWGCWPIDDNWPT